MVEPRGSNPTARNVSGTNTTNYFETIETFSFYYSKHQVYRYVRKMEFVVLAVVNVPIGIFW